MEFILALVLLVFWAVRFGVDKSKTGKADVRIDNMKMDMDQWRRRVQYTDSQEEAMREGIISPSRYGAMKKSALETIRSFHGLEYACFENNKKGGEESIRQMVKYIESVKRGKLPSPHYDTVPRLDEVLDLHIPRTARIEFAQWIEKTMQENGVPEARLYVMALGGYIQYVWEPYNHMGNYTSAVTKESVRNIRVNDLQWISKMTGGYSDELCEELNAPLIARNKARQELVNRYNNQMI